MEKVKKQAFNPYLPSWEYVPDGEPHIFNNRLYVYGSHDRFGGTTYCMEPYVCWSAPLNDLSDWTYHGVIYTGKDDTLNKTKQELMFAPDVAEHNGKYYLYYGLESSIAISVAVSDVPEGPYTFYGHVKHKDGQILGFRDGDNHQFDPGIFKDDDGKIYLYSGFSVTEEVAERIKKRAGDKASVLSIPTNGNWVMELEDDMLTLKTEPIPLLPGASNSAGTGFENHEFFEASSMRKFNGKYYAVYSSVQGHELCYAMSDYPNKDFEYKGVLHSNGNIGISEKPLYYYANNHGSLVEINGEYYIFGHRHTCYSQYQRQGVAEKLTMHEDGSFEQAEMTSCGLNGKPLEGIGKYPSYIACVLMSAQGACKADVSLDKSKHPAITQDNEKNSFITNIKDGTVIGYKYFNIDTPCSISMCVKSSGKGRFAIRTDIDGKDIASISIEPTNKWTEYTAEINEIIGTCALYFVYSGEGSVEFSNFTLNNTK